MSAIQNFAVQTAERQSALQPHLVPLSDGQWALWRTIGLRGAGFPVSQVLKLADPDCAAAADQLNDSRSDWRQACSQALIVLHDNLKQVDKTDSVLLEKAIRLIKKGRLPQALPGELAQSEALGRLQVTSARLETCTKNFQQSFAESTTRRSCAIQETVQDKRFSEAVIWQNRHAFLTGLKSLLRHSGEPASSGSKYRQHEELVGNYLQRYCVKNDTIGFFGPVGWAHFTPLGAALTVEPGQQLLATRRVYFESWGIDALAEALSRDKSLRPWIAPRRFPFAHLEQTTLHLPGGVLWKLSLKEAAVWQCCDGWQTAKVLARGLLDLPALNFVSEQEIYLMLERLVAKGAIAWTFEVPVEKEAERRLRKLLEKIEENSLRSRALAALTKLEAARDAVAFAAGDPDQLDQRQGELEAQFKSLTGAAPTRAAGEVYAARTLVYEDCRRDIQVMLGPPLLKELEQPLALLLASARWLTFEVAKFYRAAADRIYDELSASAGSSVINATDFWIKADQIIYKEQTRLADRIVPVFQKRWADVLQLAEGERCVCFTSERLRPRVLKTFDAPRPGWGYARYHCPDVMIAAASAEAIQRGDYQLVLGEMHLGVNTLISSLFLAQHPSPEEIFQAVEADFQAPRIVPVPPKHWPTLTARTSIGYVSSHNFRLEFSYDSCGVPPSQSLPISALVIERAGQDLQLRTRDGRTRFDLIEAFGEVLSGVVMNFFNILPVAAHMPRVTIDRLIVRRESWCFAAAAMDFAYEKDETARFLAARAWKRQNDLPRFIFVKAPVEKKPFYIDLASPLYVRILAKAIRRTKESEHVDRPITVTEMIPTHDQIWLPDNAGNQYTSELRMVAVDLAGLGECAVAAH